jgi:hypothetical protein
MVPYYGFHSSLSLKPRQKENQDAPTNPMAIPVTTPERKGMKVMTITSGMR